MATFDEYLASLGMETAEEVAQFYGRRGRGYGGYYGGSQDPGYIYPYGYRGLSREDMPGDRLYADLIRAQLQDYLQRFAPVEDFLASNITATGTGQLEADLERTRESVLSGRQNVTGQQRRSRERYGLTAAPVTAERSNSMVGTLVGGLNLTRQRDADRRNALLIGGLGEVGAKARTTQ